VLPCEIKHQTQRTVPKLHPSLCRQRPPISYDTSEEARELNLPNLGASTLYGTRWTLPRDRWAARIVLTKKGTGVLVIGFDNAVFAIGTIVEAVIALVVESRYRMAVPMGFGAAVTVVNHATIDKRRHKGNSVRCQQLSQVSLASCTYSSTTDSTSPFKITCSPLSYHATPMLSWFVVCTTVITKMTDQMVVFTH